MRRILIPFLTALMLIGAAAATAIAAEVDEVAAAATSDGFFVERGSSITEQQAGLLVGEMRNAGGVPRVRRRGRRVQRGRTGKRARRGV
jgi:hypothetical protein